MDIDQIQKKAMEEYQALRKESRKRWATTYIGLAHTTAEMDHWDSRWDEDVELVAYGEGQEGEVLRLPAP